jgi:MFS family permease
MYSVYSTAAYPFGILADRIDRRRQLALGTLILIGAAIVLSVAVTIWTVALGIVLWGLQMGVTQGLLAAAVADAAPARLRGTAFGIYDMIVGVATFSASAMAGALWMLGGPWASFTVTACMAVGVIFVLLFWPIPKVVHIIS